MDKGPAEKPGMAPLTRAILLLFFVSGSLGLIYEVVWLRMLILIFGSTHFAVSTVLTAFMAGLALGAWVVGRQIDRRWDPLVVYGLFEIAIGLYALAIPWLFGFLEPVGRWLWAAFAPTYYTFSLMRFFFVSAVLLLPASLMGGTLPALARFVTRRKESMGLSVGSLYGVNTFGAVAGTAATGFLLIPLLGVQATIYLAASLNVLVGAVALGIFARSRARDAERAAGTEEGAAEAPAPAGGLPPRVVLVLAVFALSGFFAMVYEIAWTRVLALILGSSVYAFTIMLTTFLVGLAGGASIMARLADRIGPRLGIDAVAVLMAGAGIAAFATLSLFESLPRLFSLAFHAIHGGTTGGGSHLLLFGLEFLLAGIVMLPATLILGGMFPLVVRICGESLERVGHTVGTAYASNTVGTIFGSALGGFVLVPLFGIQGSIVLAVMSNFLLAAVILTRAGAEPTRRRVMAAILMAVAAVGAWALQPDWNTLRMNSGVYAYAVDMGERELTAQGFHDFTEGAFDLVFYREGVTATVMVAAEKGSDHLLLTVNGKIDASSIGDLQTQLLSAHLPLLLADERRDVAVIGYASGITVGAATLHPIESLTAVEIEPAVIEASREFSEHNHNPLADDRVEIVEADGRNFLLVTDETYDVIISEPSNPWMTVASNLFTREFFEIGRSRLKPGGIFCQWLQIYGMQPADVKALARTFLSVFPHVVVFNSIPEADLLILGSDHRLDIPLARIAERMADLEVALDLGRIDVTGVHDLMTYFMMGTKQLVDFAGEGPLNTDDNALIEFHAPKNLHSNTRTENVKELAGHFSDALSHLSAPPAAPGELAAWHEQMARAFLRRGMLEQAGSELGRAVSLEETGERVALKRRIEDLERERTRS